MRGRINRLSNKVTRLANFTQRTKAQRQALTRVQKDYQIWCINNGIGVNRATLLGIK
jgi:succinyl-CoA synthetase beta subunit